MVLAMTRPWQHPKTGLFWLRKRVPTDLLALVGKREEKRSLRTRDPSEAKQRLADALSQLEIRWRALRLEVRSSGVADRPATATMTEREAHERARWMHGYWLNKHRDNPSQQTFWPVHLYGRLFKPRLGPAFDLANPSEAVEYRVPPLTSDDLRVWEVERWCRSEADLLLQVRDLQIDDVGRTRLAEALAASVQRASLELERFSQGHVDALPAHAPMAASSPHGAADLGQAPVTFEQIFKGWAAEKRPAERTRYEWLRVLNELISALGHDDARRITASDLVAWKRTLIEAGRQAKTIRDGRLAPVRAVLQWAVDNGHLASNPAERVTIDVQRKAGEKKRSFTDDEAALILRASLRERDPVLRWVPWLCAFTGARISEVCQLRASDICQIEGLWAVKFDPGAGSLKNVNSERVVPLHPALLQQGIVEFAANVQSGPLFADLKPDRFAKRGGNGTKVLGRWVRSLGLTDQRLSPVHSWRHRFKTSGRRFGLAPDLLDAITGHAPRTVADGYGEYPMSALHREILKIPPIELSDDALRSTPL